MSANKECTQRIELWLYAVLYVMVQQMHLAHWLAKSRPVVVQTGAKMRVQMQLDPAGAAGGGGS